MPATEPLRADVDADVCVVGAGIAGLTTAYLLGRERQSVVVLEDGFIGGGQTGRTTGHLSTAIDCRYFTVARRLGDEGARLVAESHAAAIDLIESICERERIGCAFSRVDGFLFDPPDTGSSVLEREYEAARAAGVAGVERVHRAPIGSFDTGECLRFPNQAQFHPTRYLAGLAKAVLARGGSIHTETHADNVVAGEPLTIPTQGGPVVRARAVVLATNTPIGQGLAIHTRQAPYVTYAIAARIQPGVVARALYWDTLDPYHYIRLAPLGNGLPGTDDLIIVGGEDHKVGQPADDEGLARLTEWSRARFAGLGPILWRWSGQVMESIDKLGLIGASGDVDGVYLATGDSGMGLTHGTIAAATLTDLILGRRNHVAHIYDPGRAILNAATVYVRENLNAASQYTHWLTASEYGAVDEVPRGSGAVFWRGLHKVAVYRDDQGRLHELSAVCPHANGIVSWNRLEQTWDCPCHGSRFDCLGRVLHGPANQDLEPLNQDAAPASDAP